MKKKPYRSESQRMMMRLEKYRKDQDRAGKWIAFLIVVTIATFIANLVLGG